MTGVSDQGPAQAATARARALVTEALDLLDAHGGRPEAAAHLELALQELRKAATTKG